MVKDRKEICPFNAPVDAEMHIFLVQKAGGVID